MSTNSSICSDSSHTGPSPIKALAFTTLSTFTDDIITCLSGPITEQDSPLSPVPVFEQTTCYITTQYCTTIYTTKYYTSYTGSIIFTVLHEPCVTTQYYRVLHAYAIITHYSSPHTYQTQYTVLILYVTTQYYTLYYIFHNNLLHIQVTKY